MLWRVACHYEVLQDAYEIGNKLIGRERSRKRGRERGRKREGEREGEREGRRIREVHTYMYMYVQYHC